MNEILTLSLWQVSNLDLFMSHLLHLWGRDVNM